MVDRNTIKSYLKSAPRNRIVVLSDCRPFPEVPVLDLGLTISTYIVQSEIRDDKNLKILVSEELKKQFRTIASQTEDFGKAICLRNLGIVFEKELGIDMRVLLQDLSRNTTVFIEWPGAYCNQRLLFLDVDSPIYIDLSEISHIHEI